MDFSNLFSLLLLLSFHTVQSSDVLKVITSEGTVVGRKASDGNYTAFYGIPYGGSTSGKNRFKSAPPPSSYNLELEADRSVLCAQPGPDGLLGVEDCLTLKLFTNNVKLAKPVLVWLHGEDYSSTYTTNTYSYKTYAESGLVVIVVNYRLSIFGFLCLGEQQAPGNAGLKDVVQALNWINKNIQSFGGDPNNVALVGHGSGAAMVELLTLSPQTDKLIHKAIAISGSALSPWAIAYDPKGYAKTVTSKILSSSEIDNNVKLAESLQGIEAAKLVTEINKIGITFTNQSLLFAPCIENPGLSDAFLTKPPLELLRSGKYNHVSYIAGYVGEEGTMRVKEALGGWLQSIQTNFTTFLPIDLKFQNAKTQSLISTSIRKSYFDDKDIGIDTINDFLDYEGEIMIQSPIIKAISERAKTSAKPVRLFAFVYEEGASSKWPYQNIKLSGLPHGRILDYILDEHSPSVPKSYKDFLVKRIFAFAKTGVPVADNEPGDVAWKQVTAQDYHYLRISGRRTDLNDPRESLALDPPTVMTWDDFHGAYYRQPQSVSSSNRGMSSAMSLTMCFMVLLTAHHIPDAI